MKLSAIAGNAGTSADEADVKVNVNLTDVRKHSDLADYTGQLQARLRPGHHRHGQRAHARGPRHVVCRADALHVALRRHGLHDVGSTCSLTTTADAVAPGTVLEGRRSVWGLGVMRSSTGGPTATRRPTPNTTFARQGLFVP